MSEEIKVVEPENTVADSTDDPGLRIGIGIDEKTGSVVVAFGKDVSWIAFSPEEGKKFGEMIMDKSKQQLDLLAKRVQTEVAEADKIPDQPEADEIQPDHSDDAEGE